jgi:hypothetical protein
MSVASIQRSGKANDCKCEKKAAQSVPLISKLWVAHNILEEAGNSGLFAAGMAADRVFKIIVMIGRQSRAA